VARLIIERKVLGRKIGMIGGEKKVIDLICQEKMRMK
jgi:hypothetical protein